MKAASLSPDTVTVEQLAPVDHFHARGFPATVELADALLIREGHHIVDIGCGIGGPALFGEAVWLQGERGRYHSAFC